MQVIARSCLALAVTIFCLTIVACYVSVSFLNVCYVGFGPVFFCTYEECKALIKLSGSLQGHPWFVILAATYDMHVAHCHSTHAEANTLLKLNTERPKMWAAALEVQLMVIHACISAFAWPNTERPKMWAAAFEVQQLLKGLSQNLPTAIFAPPFLDLMNLK